MINNSDPYKYTYISMFTAQNTILEMDTDDV